VKKREARGVASSGPRPRCVDQPNARGRCWMRGTVLVAERRGSRMPARRSRAPARCTVPVCAFTQSEHFTNTPTLAHHSHTHTTNACHLYSSVVGPGRACVGQEQWPRRPLRHAPQRGHPRR
jgi:hypothetical protein